MTLDDAPAVLTVDDLAKTIRCGRNTAYELVRSGQIFSIRLGAKAIRIPRRAVEDFLSDKGEQQ